MVLFGAECGTSFCTALWRRRCSLQRGSAAPTCASCIVLGVSHLSFPRARITRCNNSQPGEVTRLCLHSPCHTVWTACVRPRLLVVPVPVFQMAGVPQLCKFYCQVGHHARHALCQGLDTTVVAPILTRFPDVCWFGSEYCLCSVGSQHHITGAGGSPAGSCSGVCVPCPAPPTTHPSSRPPQVALTVNNDIRAARLVKGRLEKTLLGQVARHIRVVLKPGMCVCMNICLLSVVLKPGMCVWVCV